MQKEIMKGAVYKNSVYLTEMLFIEFMFLLFPITYMCSYFVYFQKEI